MWNKELALSVLTYQITERQALKDLISGKGNPEEWASICKDNLNSINAMVNEHGWPRADLFENEAIGKVIEYAAWMCVQHGDANNMYISRSLGQNAGDQEKIAQLKEEKPELFIALEETITMQEQCLAIMHRDQAAPYHIAFVTDRIARNKCEAQIYGTQYEANPLDPAKIDTISNPEQLEDRRSAMSLDSYKVHKGHIAAINEETEEISMLLPPIIRDNRNIRSYADDLLIPNISNLQAKVETTQPASQQAEEATTSSFQKEEMDQASKFAAKILQQKDQKNGFGKNGFGI